MDMTQPLSQSVLSLKEMGLYCKHWFGVKGASGFGSSSTAEDVANKFGTAGAANKVFLVTGCNTGIGKETVRILCKFGATVVMACRDKTKMHNAQTEILAEIPGASLHCITCDLSSLRSVESAVQQFQDLGLPGLHCLITNAGVAGSPTTFTQDGIELMWGTNVVGHFHLVNLMLPQLRQTGTVEDPARVVILASGAHALIMGTIRPDSRAYCGPVEAKASVSQEWKRYCESKLGNVLHCSYLNTKLKEEGVRNVVCVSVHPGAIQTDLLRNSPGWLKSGIMKIPGWKTIPQGAATTMYAATAPADQLVSGAYYADCNLSGTTRAAKSASGAKICWEVCEQLVSKAKSGWGE
eukprot:TRINITY_DN85268_c0_g1_i1.p1 TRINITY_DN85268_c0_g1~~TRINITY_DN85268_c0_g1_i1.p1  ORF type:complete len:352 (+),score=27.40 TRINITY_DN85268_c0_g1_i1:24-1079(+)